jgi:hypothetical protein
MQPARRRFDRSDSGGAFDDRLVPAAGQGQRDRKDGAIAVNHVHREQERNAESRFLDGDPLQRSRRMGACDVEIRADQSGADAVPLFVIDAAVRAFLPAAGELHELAKLLIDRHGRDQLFDARGIAVAFRRGRLT